MKYNFPSKILYFGLFFLNFSSVLSIEPEKNRPYLGANLYENNDIPLHMIVSYYPELLNWILEHRNDIDVNKYYENGINTKVTALYRAVREQKIETAEELLKAGASPEEGRLFFDKDAEEKHSCTELVYLKKNKEIIELLARYGANIDSISKQAESDRCTLPQISCLFSDDCKKKEEIYMFIKELKSKGN